MLDVAAIPEIISRPPPASAEQIRLVSAHLITELPGECVSLLKQANGVVANHLVFYSCDEIAERNRTFEVALYAPDFVMIGDDNGGRGILMRGGRRHSPVYLVDQGSMQPSNMIRIADSLAKWITAGCPFELPKPVELLNHESHELHELHESNQQNLEQT